MKWKKIILDILKGFASAYPTYYYTDDPRLHEPDEKTDNSPKIDNNSPSAEAHPKTK